MSFAATHDAKDRIRQAIDIVELVGSYLPLRRQGRNFVGICPWHDDSRPSLQVNPERGSWKCWVCNVGGDIFSFVMQREGVEFREALQMLADRAGVPLTNQASPPTRPGDPSDKRTLFEALAWAEKQFRDCLRNSPEAEVARRYFADRNLNPATIDQFNLGFVPNSWQWIIDRARSTSFSTAVLQAVGLANQHADTGRYYDFFRGRVIFPIRDTQNRPIAFGARVLPGFEQEGTGKYINSRDSRLFSKSEQLYALDLARDAITKSKHAIVVEGYMDVIMCHQHGFHNVVAVLGTALGQKHVSLLRRYADRITLLLDGDEAGQRRTNEVLQMFVASEVDLRIATLPDELDPCELLEERPADALRELIEQAPDALEHAIHVQTRGIDLDRDTHRANRSLEALLGILGQAPRLSSDTSTAKLLRERQVIARLAREFRIDETALRQRLTERRWTEQHGSGVTPRRAAVSAEPQPVVRAQDLPPLEAELLEILGRHPELVEMALTELTAEQLTSEPTRQIWEVYRQVAQRGESPRFLEVLGELEEPQLTGLLVELDERASSKEAYANADAATRLCRLIEDLHYRHQAPDRRRQLATLERKQLADAEELQLLQQLVQQERKRQGIPAPTDG